MDTKKPIRGPITTNPRVVVNSIIIIDNHAGFWDIPVNSDISTKELILPRKQRSFNQIIKLGQDRKY